MNANQTEIARHKTAIKRPSYSLPISCLLRDGLVHAETSFFDYGCGHGQDIELLRGAGIHGDGWDPAHRADGQRRPADVVNLGYVINVIEDARERAAAVRAAWELSNKLLVVAAQIEFAAPDKEQPRFADGVLTSRGTFQKYYTQTELRAYLESELATDAIPAAPEVARCLAGVVQPLVAMHQQPGGRQQLRPLGILVYAPRYTLFRCQSRNSSAILIERGGVARGQPARDSRGRPPST